MRLSVLIVDDEPHARRHLKNLLSKDADVDTIYECKNGKEVLNFLNNKVPNVIFLDINMPGLNGVEVASKLKNVDTLIVFSTAYDQYALKAFELEAFDYLLKPFENTRFYDVLNRVKAAVEKNHQAQFSEKFATLYKAYNNEIMPHLTEFVIKEKGFEHRISVSDILYLETSSIYVELHLQDKTVLYRSAMNLLEQQLSSIFVRVHRSFIINSEFVESVKYLNNSTYKFTMTNGDVIVSSRKYKTLIAEHFS